MNSTISQSSSLFRPCIILQPHFLRREFSWTMITSSISLAQARDVRPETSCVPADVECVVSLNTVRILPFSSNFFFLSCVLLHFLWPMCRKRLDRPAVPTLTSSSHSGQSAVDSCHNVVFFLILSQDQLVSEGLLFIKMFEPLSPSLLSCTNFLAPISSLVFFLSES